MTLMQFALALIVFPFFQLSASLDHIGTPLRAHMENEFVWAIDVAHEQSLAEIQREQPAVTELILSRKMKDGFRQLWLVKGMDQKSTQNLMSDLANQDNTTWVHPSFVYEGDPREFIPPNDPLFSDQLHHQIMKNPQAWENHQNLSNIVVAVTDDGFDLDHEDLNQSYAINPNEIPNNQIDDDQNGFVDDVNGWDFTDEDNDPRPNGGSHGTHVMGIINAAINNEKGIVGSAPSVKVLPIRFYGGRVPWGATLVAKSYKYAADMGAKIITTSFNIDNFWDDPIYHEGVNYAYDKGLLIFNSAGNNRYQNPRRTRIHKVILVASTNVKPSSRDTKSSFSNYGVGIDIAAPGSNILSTLPKNNYGEKSGTSMASPNAAAVAARIWAANPEWTREQVLSKMFASADNINNVNSSYVDLLGAGRVNSFKAQSRSTRPPQILKIQNRKNNATYNAMSNINVVLKEIFDPATVNDLTNWSLQKITKMGREEINLDKATEYFLGTNVIVFTFDSLDSGRYEFRASASGLANPLGQKLDGNGDGVPGDDYVLSFNIK